MDQLGLGAKIRRQESLSILKQKDDAEPEFIGYGSESGLPSDPETPPDTNALQRFKDELLDIDRKKREHLTLSAPKGGGLMRLSTLLVILLFAISGGLFFLGGYLYSFNSPPAGSGISTSPAQSLQSKPDWRIGTVIESPAATQAAAPVPQSYMARRQIIERNEVLADRVYGDTESRVNYAARQEAKKIVSKTASDIKTSVRSVVGDTIGRVFNPIADTVVKGSLGEAIDGAMPVQKSVDDAMQAAQGAASGGGAGSSGSASAGGVSGSAVGSTLGSGSASAAPQAQSSASPMPGGMVGDLFALELQTFYDTTDAFLFMRNLKEQGYSATYMVRSNVGRNVVFKVRIGNFATYADANATRKLLAHPSRVVLATKMDDPLAY